MFAIFLGILPALAPMTDAVGVSGVGRGGRIPFAPDAVTAQIVRGTFGAPRAGDALKLPDGNERKWTELKANAEGFFTGAPLGGGYVFTTYTASEPKTMILEALGHSLVYVNGVLRTGDPYQYGYVRLPVRLAAGPNTFLFSCGRGRLKASLVEPVSEVMLNPQDLTAPDLYPGDKGTLRAAIPIVNARETNLDGYTIRCELAGKVVEVAGARVLPLGTRKVPFNLPVVSSEKESLEATVKVIQKGATIAETQIQIRVRKLGQTYKRTFVSDVDGSLQYFAVVPQTTPSPGSALVLTLHGASVEATSQADAYRSKDWATIVAATNRRPFGFDWEDIGRLDALEVLREAKRLFRPDEDRVYLTGHSMGGHGTWQVGVQYPDLFAGIAPSAGWISFYSYAGGVRVNNPSPMQEIIQRAASPSDTLTLSQNYKSYPVFILHGDADDNVPVSEARTMRDHLAGFHPAVRYHEQKGAGHWWGNECVDWPGIFDMFRESRRPSRARIDFSTNSLAVSNRYAWVTLQRQRNLLKTSRVQLEQSGTEISGTTDNVDAISLDVKATKAKTAVLDGSTVTLGSGPVSHLRRTLAGDWVRDDRHVDLGKWGTFSGPFKSVFDKRVVFVYGTKGSSEENSWMLQKARFDAETLWYRGNGAVDVVADRDYRATRFKGRNVLLYGNSAVNSAWMPLLSDCPIKVGPAGILVGPSRFAGDMATCFVYPSAQDRVLVGAVGGTGLGGFRLTDRMPYFTSGVALPDFAVFDAGVYDAGSAAVLSAGFFDNDWRLGEVVTR